MSEEDVQQVVSYPAAPTRGKSSNTPIPEDAPVESSPTDAAAAPSAAEEQAPQPEPDKTFNMPPPERWEELRKERDDARRLAELALQKLQAPQPTQAPQPEVDPYAGMDAPTAEFYRQMDRRIEQKASALADQKLQGVLQAVDAGRQELASIKIAQFRKENPDIKQGSPEETAIAGYVQQGFTLDHARKLALYDKLETENRAFKTKQAAVPRKAAANVESSAGIPESSGLPGRPGDWRQKASEVIDQGGDMLDIANTLFGRKRKP